MRSLSSIMFKFVLLCVVVVTSIGGSPQIQPKNIPRQSVGIVGGRDADITDYPYQLSLTFRGYHYCGAVLISPRFVLTTASCISGSPPENQSIRAGSSYFTGEGGQLVNVLSGTKHPHYNTETREYDIAVLELESDITIDTASPIELHESGYVAEDGTPASITGFGATEELGVHADVLQVLDTLVIDNRICNASYHGLVTDRELCAGNIEETGHDACTGDIGGPIAIDGKLAGLTTFGLGCGRIWYPRIFTSVTHPDIREFITELTGL